jgi:hypothetical protein
VSPSDGFTPREYEAILDAAQTHGYGFARFTDPVPSPGQRLVYLRHDVDNTLEAAVRMAEAEARLDAVATYLVLVRSDNYNPFSRTNVERMHRIRRLGHDLGLHFAPREHDATAIADDLASCVLGDARLLESALGGPISVFSFHNPSDERQYNVEVPGLINAYADHFFADACYLSESNMRWPAGSPVEVLAREEHPVVQILVHPLTYRADLTSDRDVLLWFLREKVRDLLELNVRENRVLREQPLTTSDVAAFLTDTDR